MVFDFILLILNVLKIIKYKELSGLFKLSLTTVTHFAVLKKNQRGDSYNFRLFPEPRGLDS